jgi:4'-phosphopantetheinyl transferase
MSTHLERDDSLIYQEVPSSIADVQTALNALSLPEYEEYQRFGFEKRRREWLAGRLAAKKAVRTLSESDPKWGKLDLNEIILKPSNGHPPSILLSSFPDWGPKVDISLSHSGDWAIACARFKSTPTFRIGIDIEKVATPDLDILPIVFTSAEQDLIQLNPLNYFRFWTAKEAVLKALGLGLTIDLRELEVVDSTHLKKGNSLEIRMRPNSYRVQISQWRNYIVAYCEIP